MYLLRNLESNKLNGELIKRSLNDEIDFYLLTWVKLDSIKYDINFKNLFLKLESDYSTENLNNIFKHDIKNKVYQ